MYMIFLFVIVLLLLDYLYLSTFGKTFAGLVETIQHSPFRLNITGAVMSYFTIAMMLYYFIIKDKRPVQDAFILGALTYGVFDFTNLALFSKYDWKIGMIDTLWGGILFAVTTFITYRYLM